MAVTRAAVVGRAGILAAALGVGAAVGLAICAPASAAPTDSAGSSSRAVSDKQAPAAVRRASVGNRERTAAPAATRLATPPAASTPVAVTVVPVPPTPDSATAVPWRQVRKFTVKAAAAVAAPVANSFPWSDPRGRQITIYKGTHFAIPNSFGYFVQQTVGTGTFTNNSVYDLKDVDQYDWNKFTGIAFTPLEPDRNSAMVGWRYNLTSQEFEIAPFYNVDKIRILPNENPLSPGYEVISVPTGETFQFNVDYAGITLIYGDRTVYKPYPPGLTPNVWTAARVSGWFGGNEVAPRTVSYFLRLN